MFYSSLFPLSGTVPGPQQILRKCFLFNCRMNFKLIPDVLSMIVGFDREMNANYTLSMEYLLGRSILAYVNDSGQGKLKKP